MSDRLIGRTLAGYRIDASLGPSGAGTLYKATQLSVARPVVLKVLDDVRSYDRKRLLGFIKEVRTAGNLNHPGIVQVHEVCQERESIFYSMEYLPEGSLRELLQKNGRFRWRKVWSGDGPLPLPLPRLLASGSPTAPVRGPAAP